MKKSSLGRRSSVFPGVASLCIPTCNKPERKSQLLQPGFAQTQKPQSNRRSLSADRYSEKKPTYSATCSQKMHKSRSEWSLSELPASTPLITKILNLPSGSSQPNRLRSSTIGSCRLSSTGNVRSCKKETRPINEKSFQTASLRKVEDFVYELSNWQQLLDKSEKVYPMNFTKFLNIAGYLLQCIDERTQITKDNYIEVLQNTGKQLNYNGKLDRSWLVTVSAPHSWPNVIAYLVWLVDIVRLFEAAGSSNFLYPSDLGEEQSTDVLAQNMKSVHPLLVKNYTMHCKQQNKDPEDLEEEFDRMDDALCDELLIKYKLSENDMKQLLEEEAKLQAKLQSSQFEKKKALLEEQEIHFQSLLEKRNRMKESITENKSKLEIIKKTNETREQNISKLKTDLKNKLAERDVIREELKKLKCDEINLKEEHKLRQDLRIQIIHYEKCISRFSTLIYQLDIKSAKINNQLDDALVEYKTLIAVNTTLVRMSESCPIQDMMALTNSDGKEVVAKARQILKQLKDQLAMAVTAAKLHLEQLDKTHSSLQEKQTRESQELEKLNEELKSIENNQSDLIKKIEKEKTKLENIIKDYEEKTKELIEKAKPLIKERENLVSTLKSLEIKNKLQRDEIKRVEQLAVQYFEVNKAYIEQAAQETMNSIQNTVEEIKQEHEKRKNK